MDEVEKMQFKIVGLETNVSVARAKYDNLVSNGPKDPKGPAKGQQTKARNLLGRAQEALRQSKEKLASLLAEKNANTGEKRGAPSGKEPESKKGKVDLDFKHGGYQSSPLSSPSSSYQELPDAAASADNAGMTGNQSAISEPLVDGVMDLGVGAVNEYMAMHGDGETDENSVEKDLPGEDKIQVDGEEMAGGKSLIMGDGGSMAASSPGEGKLQVDGEETAGGECLIMGDGGSMAASLPGEGKIQVDGEEMTGRESLIMGDGKSMATGQDDSPPGKSEVQVDGKEMVGGESEVESRTEAVAEPKANLLAMPDLPEEEQKQEEIIDTVQKPSKTKPKKKKKAIMEKIDRPGNTYEELSDEERDKLPGVVRREFRAFLGQDKTVVSGTYRRMIRENQELLPEAATISRKLALHILTTTHGNSQCLYHHKTKTEGKPNGPYLLSGTPGPRVTKSKTNPDPPPPAPGLLHCGCEMDVALMDFIFWKTWKVMFASPNRPDMAPIWEGMSSQMFEPRARMFIVNAFRNYTGLTLDKLYTGPGDTDVDESAEFPNFSGLEHQRKNLRDSIPVLLGNLRELNMALGGPAMGPEDMVVLMQQGDAGSIGIDPTLQ
ncbi:hypothetical protein FPV67DRAFT_1453986 [Lyophyllum atratum]|nr:hypothetical protein FPV67DRAFT_1453986 [Lyophyllum atratum]